MGRYLLGVDVGTTSLKVAIIDENAALQGISSKAYRLITPRQDYVQIDAESMWNAFVECVRLLRGGKNIDMSEIAGIGISSLCPGLVALGENGEVLCDPIIYSDRRSKEEAELILKAVDSEKLFEITANGSMAGAFSGSSMLWIKRNLPEVYAKTKYFGHLNTFLAQGHHSRYARQYGLPHFHVLQAEEYKHKYCFLKNSETQFSTIHVYLPLLSYPKDSTSISSPTATISDGFSTLS